MKTQTKLSELDALKLTNIQLRQQLIAGELQAFQVYVAVEYGNEGETVGVQADGGIVRTPKATPPEEGR